MGHVSSIALGVAITNKKRIICDGDGSFLMHLGALAIMVPNNWVILNIF